MKITQILFLRIGLIALSSCIATASSMYKDHELSTNNDELIEESPLNGIKVDELIERITLENLVPDVRNFCTILSKERLIALMELSQGLRNNTIGYPICKGEICKQRNAFQNDTEQHLHFIEYHLFPALLCVEKKIEFDKKSRFKVLNSFNKSDIFKQLMEKINYYVDNKTSSIERKAYKNAEWVINYGFDE